MITEKFTPLQIRRIERASRNGRREKKRIANASTHRSKYRWSSDSRHELRVYNAVFKKDRFWDRIEMRESEDAYDIEGIVERELKAEAELERAKQLEAEKQMEELQLALCMLNSFDSEDFMEKLFEEDE